MPAEKDFRSKRPSQRDPGRTLTGIESGSADLGSNLNEAAVNDAAIRRTGWAPLPFLLPFLLPLGVMLGVLLLSPNFHWLETKPGQDIPFRADPYGGDFLQDWVGGKIAAVPRERELLYPTRLANQLQHSGVVGFAWPEQQYFPMVYPPYYYWLVSLFSYLPYRWSAIVWTILSTAMFAFSGWLLHRSHPVLNNKAWPLMLAMTAFVPWMIALNMGQKSTGMLLLFTATFALLARRQMFLAGMIFGLVAIKPQLGIVIGVAMIVNQQWAFVAGSVLTVSGLLGLAQGLNSHWLAHYWEIISAMGDYTSTGGYQLPDSHSFLGGLKHSLPSAMENWIKPLTLALTLIILGVISWAISARRSRYSKIDEHELPSALPGALPFALMVFASVLVSPHLYTYDLTILILPMLLVFSGAQSKLRPISLDPVANPDSDQVSQSNSDEFDSSVPLRIVQGLVVLLYVSAGFLPQWNQATGISWGCLLILTIVVALSWHLMSQKTAATEASERTLV